MALSNEGNQNIKTKIGVLFTWGSTKNGNIGVKLTSKVESTQPVKVKVG